MNKELRIRELTPAQLSTRDIQNWLRLESRAIEANIYLSPHFIIPALRYLDPGNFARLIIVECIGSDKIEMLGLAVMVMSPGNSLVPLPHLSTHQTSHSYLGTPLIDSEQAPRVIAFLLKYLRKVFGPFMGILWENLSLDGEVVRLLHASTHEQGMGWKVVRKFERPILTSESYKPDLFKTVIGKKYKEATRCMRRLLEQGNVEWFMYRETLPSKAIDTFLRLEHSGWKADEGTSLLSNSADETFFRQMVAGFASEGRAMFTELHLNGLPIASTSNFVSGGEGFAFKIGWDIAYRQYGVGILNEVEFIRHAHDSCPDLTQIDSGSEANSFIENIWPGRRPVGSIFIPFRKLGKVTLHAYRHVRSVGASLKAKMRNKKRES